MITVFLLAVGTYLHSCEMNEIMIKILCKYFIKLIRSSFIIIFFFFKLLLYSFIVKKYLFKNFLVLLKLILVCTATKILGLPNGAPGKSCYDLAPVHPGINTQGSYPPYEIRAVAGQGRIRLTLGSPQGLAFQGFIINARDVETGEFVGEFVDLPKDIQAIECTPGMNVSYF